ncbi:hypothetical protein C8Q79DRAFT_711894 [Trametes meyenii]|nr:hypothetical protein C8Q79DRAFT_711894 [Trametes meyenii]
MSDKASGRAVFSTPLPLRTMISKLLSSFVSLLAALQVANGDPRPLCIITAYDAELLHFAQVLSPVGLRAPIV